tara:strand:- start:153 stop:338 length:186 start_codon:yes stop_codon:yes gene_type:complete
MANENQTTVTDLLIDIGQDDLTVDELHTKLDNILNKLQTLVTMMETTGTQHTSDGTNDETN